MKGNPRRHHGHEHGGVTQMNHAGGEKKRRQKEPNKQTQGMSLPRNEANKAVKSILHT
jgi:hypothetical protein